MYASLDVNNPFGLMGLVVGAVMASCRPPCLLLKIRIAEMHESWLESAERSGTLESCRTFNVCA